jgi:hypothetical protein
MQRAPETPLVLWICAAVCAHFVFAQGGDQVATFHEDRSFLYELGTRARSAAHGKDQTLEIVTNDTREEGEPPPKPPEPPEPEAQKPKDEAKKPEPLKPPSATPPKPPEASEFKVVVKPDDPLKKLDEVPLKQDSRIAVRQHAQKDQKDNPAAKFVADEANHVEEESVATQTSHDQDDPNPTPGANKTQGPKDRVGDSERTKIAESDEHRGEKNKAPGEKGTEFDVQREARPIDKAQAPVAITKAEPAAQLPRSGGDGRAPSPTPPNDVPPQLAPGAPPSLSPEVVQGAQGGYSFNPIRPDAYLESGPEAPGTTHQKTPSSDRRARSEWLGLGAKAGPGQVNLNLSHTGVVAAVGVDQLRKEREADGERRKSEHRGSWIASSFERWRSAIENYVTSVKPGNQTALNTAAVPFASYLNTIHNRIHPIFAESFLGSLSGLPRSHPMNDPKVLTRLEIVVSPKEGRIVKMGVVKTSGITAFDIAALDSVNRAQPFGPAPSAIVSPDGNVYLHWEFHRDEVYACSTMHARPFMLNTPPKAPEPEPPGVPTPSSPTRERGAPPPANINDSRQGTLPRVPGPKLSSHEVERLWRNDDRSHPRETNRCTLRRA